MTHGPTRWFEQPSELEPEFREAVAAFRGEGPSEAQLARMLQGLGASAQVDAEPPRQEPGSAQQPSMPETAAHAGFGALVRTASWKWLGVLGVLSTLAMAGWLVTARERANTSEAGVVVSHDSLPLGEISGAAQHREPETLDPRSSRVTTEPALVPAEVGQRTPTPPAPPTTRTRSPSAGRAAAPAVAATKPVESLSGAPSPRDELELLQRARRVVQAAPQRALELAEQHRTAFPAGMFVEERELLSIEALIELGKPTQAEERARRFSAQFPRSVHAQRLSTLLARAQKSSEDRVPAAHSLPTKEPASQP